MRKLLRFLLFTILGLIIIGNLFIVLSGRYYLYTGIRQTYLIGRSGPGIYDLNYFPYAVLHKAEKAEKWKVSGRYNKQPVSKRDLQYIAELDTRAFLVFKGDQLLYEKYYSDHNSNTVSNSFSAAKTVISLLIGIAMDEGKIKSLDEPVGNYIPEFKTMGREKITIKHLLLMASGLDWEESGTNPLSENAESYYGKDLYGLVTRQHRISEPGKQFNYQSGNSQILGFIIEKATGSPVAEYCQEKIWKKIGAEHEAYWSLDKEGGDEKAFCCLYATARDFGKLGKLILQKGKWKDQQVIPEWYMKEMLSLQKMGTSEGIPNQRYGLHIWIYNDPIHTVYYCRGIKGQYIFSIPEEDLVIVRLGTERAKSYYIPEDKKNDQDYLKANAAKVDHPTDIMRYIAIGRKIAAESN